MFEQPVSDLLVLALMLAAFLTAGTFARACDDIIGPGQRTDGAD